MADGRSFMLLFLLAFLCPVVFALEISAEAGALFFKPASGEGEVLDKAGLLDGWYGAGTFQVKDEITDRWDFDLSFAYDPVLLSRVVTLIGFHSNYLDIRAGPVFSVPEWKTLRINPGISLALDLSLPGVVFGTLMAETTFGDVRLAGDYRQRYALVKTGFWVPHVIFSLAAEIRSLVEKINYTELTNEWIRYTFSMDIFKKNAPLSVLINAGYEKLWWFTGGAGQEYIFHAFFAGLEPALQIKPRVKFFFGAEVPFYFWTSRNSVVSEPYDAPMFLNFNLGMTWSMN
jgi:hypothetical protein